MAAPEPFSRIITDETLLENVRHGSPAFPLQYYYENIWDFDFHCVDWHWHPELEYVYVQSGQAICFAGNEKLIVNAGCGLLINSRVIHRFEAESRTIIPNVVYSPSLLAPENSLLYQKYLLPFVSASKTHGIFLQMKMLATARSKHLLAKTSSKHFTLQTLEHSLRGRCRSRASVVPVRHRTYLCGALH